MRRREKVRKKVTDLSALRTLTCERPTRGHITGTENAMKNRTKPALALRAHSIRNLTTAELRLAQGGCAAGCHSCSNTKPGSQ